MTDTNPETVEPTKLDLMLYRNRRRMAWLCLALMSASGAYLIWAGLRSDEEAARVAAMMPLVTTLYTAWGTVILAYVASKTITEWRFLGPD